MTKRLKSSSGFTLLEMFVSIAIGAMAFTLIATFINSVIRSSTRTTEIKNVGDATRLIHEILQGIYCDYSMRVQGTGAKISGYPGAAATDIQIEMNDPFGSVNDGYAPTHVVAVTTGPLGSGNSSLVVDTLQLQQISPGKGVMTNVPMFYTVYGTTTKGSTVVTNVLPSVIPGASVSNISSAYNLAVGQEVLGAGIANDPSNVPPMMGAVIQTVNNNSFTMSVPATRNGTNVPLQIGGYYTTYASLITMKFHDANTVQNGFQTRKIPVIVAVGNQSNTIDRCFKGDATLLCASLGGSLDSNGVCARTFYDRFTNNACDAGHVWGGVDCPAVAGNSGTCKKVYLLTGVSSAGDPICQCFNSCTP